MTRLVLCAFVCAGAATQLAAQTPALSLAGQARVQLVDLNADSAQKLLQRSLGVATTPAEKIRAWSLLGFAEIGRNNTTAARDAFVQALRIDASLAFDTLMFIEPSNGPNVFALARAIVPLPARPTFPVASRDEAVAALVLNVAMSRDTLISVDDARYPIGALPSWSAEVVSSVVAADRPNAVIWADTIRPNARRPLAWPLKGSAGLVPNGRYILRLQASDSTGRSTSILEYRLSVARARPDTQALPAPLPASAFAPETLQVGKRSTRVLLTGSAIAAAVVATPALLGNSSLNNGTSGDPMSFAVAGSVAIASAVRFIIGRQPTLLSQANVQKNRDTRDAWQRNRDNIARANAAAIANAGLRVTQGSQ